MDVDQYLRWSVLLCVFTGFQQKLSHAVQNFNCDNKHIGHAKLFNKEDQDISGVKQICVNGNLGLQFASLCFTDYSLFTEQTAATACRQIGLDTVAENKFGPVSAPSFENLDSPNDSKYYIVDTQCPIVDDEIADGGLNLLRCHSLHTSTNISTGCGTTRNFAAVTCYPSKIYYPPAVYNGQVYIDNLNLGGGLSEPVVYIHLRNKSLPICLVGFSEYIANSVCQQLGYTRHSTHQLYTDQTQQFWYLQSDSCNDTSYPCFTNCFDTTNFTNGSGCTEGNAFGLSCIYNVTEAAVYGSGSKGLCQIESTDETPTKNETWRNVSYGLIAIIAVCILGIIAALIFGCYWYKKRPRNGERRLLNGGEGEHRHRQNERA